MKANEFITEADGISRRGILRGIGAASLAGVSQAATAGRNFYTPTPPPVPQQPVTPISSKQEEPKSTQNINFAPSTLAAFLKKTAKQAGMHGIELAQFLGQCAHETASFSKLIEAGSSSYFNKYDPRFSPGMAKKLGNTHPGDGIRYLGRGFIQLTGRDNYHQAGKAIGIPLEENPSLAANPSIAAKVALWYWNAKVKPNVNDFTDTELVTSYINPGLNGLRDRHANFLNYKKTI